MKADQISADELVKRYRPVLTRAEHEANRLAFLFAALPGEIRIGSSLQDPWILIFPVENPAGEKRFEADVMNQIVVALQAENYNVKKELNPERGEMWVSAKKTFVEPTNFDPCAEKFTVYVQVFGGPQPVGLKPVEKIIRVYEIEGVENNG